MCGCEQFDVCSWVRGSWLCAWLCFQFGACCYCPAQSFRRKKRCGSEVQKQRQTPYAGRQSLVDRRRPTANGRWLMDGRTDGRRDGRTDVRANGAARTGSRRGHGSSGAGPERAGAGLRCFHKYPYREAGAERRECARNRVYYSNCPYIVPFSGTTCA